MKIAQVSPLYESVPPRTYGGTERIVSYLTESLIEAGHEVSLFASGDSKTAADLHFTIPESLRLAEKKRDPIAAHLLEIAEVASLADQFDIIHFHTDYLHFPISRHLLTPHVTTLHGRLDLPDLPPLYDEFADVPVISISDSQRKPLPQANWTATVYHGIPEKNFDFQPQSGSYLAFVGRISPEKGVDTAIKIATQVGMPLKIAAKVDDADKVHFETLVKPLLDHPLVEFIGEVNEQQKNQLFGGAFATLFPINWPEPFGLVMIESMACGTPVIAFRHGSVPEVMKEGVSGLIVDSAEEAIGAIEKVPTIDRKKCRLYFEERFTADRMAQRYLQVYRKVCHARMTIPMGAPHHPLPDMGVIREEHGLSAPRSF